jgi:Prephenate dehydratase
LSTPVDLLKNSTAIFTLGPEGTFSDEAARFFQNKPELLRYSSTFAEALLQVSQNPKSAAVVPIENSVAGTVAQVQDALVSMDLVILGEVSLPITYSLIASADPKEIKNCYTHSQALNRPADGVLKTFLK